MPPYASQQEVFDHHDVLNSHCNDPLVDVPLGSKPDEGTNSNNNSMDVTATSAATPSKDFEGEASEQSSPSVLKRLLDFNPCMGMMGRRSDSSTNAHANANDNTSFWFPNPSSAIFKNRPCSECGGKCTKLQGYTKEIVDRNIVDDETGDESVVTTKIYFHKWCAQLKDYRHEHQKGFRAVVHEMMDYFRALELEAQVKREAEQQLRRKQQQQEAQTQKEEANRAARVTLAPLEVPRVGKTSGFWKRVKNSGKRITKSFSVTACKGNKSTTMAVIKSSSAVSGHEF